MKIKTPDAFAQMMTPIGDVKPNPRNPRVGHDVDAIAASIRDLGWHAPLVAASFAAGAHGVMVEVHPSPTTARTDARQQITPDAFDELQRDVAERVKVAPRMTRGETTHG